MTDRERLVQDLRAHAHEAPAVCAALMRRAASDLEGWVEIGGPKSFGIVANAPSNGEQKCN